MKPAGTLTLLTPQRATERIAELKAQNDVLQAALHAACTELQDRNLRDYPRLADVPLEVTQLMHQIHAALKTEGRE
jgi:hypothetical protein